MAKAIGGISASETNASSLVLWEFDDRDDADLGYTYGKPQIAKMANGRWAAVFGNGYNNTEADGSASTTGRAVLFIVDVETGALIRKIDTLAGSTTTPNGLATPVLIDSDGDQVVNYIYAGDLSGRLWKFDVTSSNAGSWAVDYTSGSTPAPLFTTENNQPITTQPQVTLHPDGEAGFMIYFGTGKYIETGDNDPTGQNTQSFYRRSPEFTIVPGRFNNLWVEATEEGIFDIYCAEYCGLQHSRMRAAVVVLEGGTVVVEKQ